MARTLPEWIGKTDDHRAPGSVRDRIFQREGGKCHLCSQEINGKKWDLDHVKALINGGENRESNLKPVHRKCHVEKTAQDVAAKAKAAAIRQKHTGAAISKQSMPPRPFPASPKSPKTLTKALPPRVRDVFGRTAEVTK